MKQSEAKDFWPLIKAWAEGKTLQWRSKYGNDEWTDMIGSCSFEYGGSQHYRIKPEPTLRPWRPEEVPVGALIRYKRGDRRVGCIIIQADINYCHYGRDSRNNYSVLMHDLEHSTDNGKTWKPCGVEE